jgi:hypothetical protein
VPGLETIAPLSNDPIIRLPRVGDSLNDLALPEIIDCRAAHNQGRISYATSGLASQAF